MKVKQCQRVMIRWITIILTTVSFLPLLVVAQSSTVLPVTHMIEIHQFAFKPANVNIKLGDTVVWINKDIVPHTATAVDGSWTTGSIGFNESESLVFDNEVLLSYYCRFHPSMKAVLSMAMLK